MPNLTIHLMEFSKSPAKPIKNLFFQNAFVLNFRQIKTILLFDK